MALNILHPGKITETTKATQAEAVAGVDNRKYMTPLRTKQVVDVVVDDVVDQALPEAIDAAIAQASPVFDDVLSVETLPQPGVSGKIYIIGAIAYHWNGTSYDQIGLSSTDELSEGTENLYFTNARAKSALADELSEIGSDLTEIVTSVNTVNEALESEAEARATADTTLTTALEGETLARTQADSALSDRIDKLASNLDTEQLDSIAEAATAIGTLQTALDLKADLISGLVPATQLPPISYQTTRHTGNGTTTAFQPPGTLTASDSPSAISVTINGVTQEPSGDYTLDVENNLLVLDAPLGLGDTLVITRPILLPSNTTLTAEQIGAASTSHKSTHATGGADAIAPNNISAAWATVLSNQTITGNTLLSAGRNRRITLFAVGATANVDLPHENNQAGDVVTLVSDWSVASTLTIRTANVMGGSAPVAYSTLATLNASGQSFTFVSNGGATGWSLRAVDTHTHAIADLVGNEREGDIPTSDGSGSVVFESPSEWAGKHISSADIGAASTSHKSTHATGGSDALTPSDIGAQSIFESQSLTLSSNVTLTSARAKTWSVGMFASGTFDITLPTSGIQVGDILVIKAATTFNGIAVIKRSATQVVIMGTLLAGRSFRFIATSTSDLGWVADGTYTHTHAIADVAGLQTTLDNISADADLRSNEIESTLSLALAALEARVAALEAAQP